MKISRFIAALALATLASTATAAPSLADQQAYADRMALYVSLGQTPDQVVTSLSNYFGKPFFQLRSNGWQMTADVIYQEGTGTGITFLTTLGTMPTP